MVLLTCSLCLFKNSSLNLRCRLNTTITIRQFTGPVRVLLGDGVVIGRDVKRPVAVHAWKSATGLTPARRTHLYIITTSGEIQK